MTLSILLTEFRRSFKNSLISFLLCLTLGFTVVVSFNFKTYLEKLFTPLQWGASVLILPKGLNPDAAYKNVLDGEPAGLLPEALYETLKAQIRDEQVKHGLTESPLEFIAFVPFKKDGVVTLGALDFDHAKDFFTKHDSLLKPFPLVDWRAAKSNLNQPEKYQTAEWKDKTFFAALANGSAEYLSQLMTLINRRTVAEAFYVDNQKSDTAVKLASLETGLKFLTGFVLGLAFLGLLLSFEMQATQRKQIYQVLNELKVEKSIQTNFYIGQVFALGLVPISLGALIGFYFWPYLKLML